MLDATRAVWYSVSQRDDHSPCSICSKKPRLSRSSLFVHPTHRVSISSCFTNSNSACPFLDDTSRAHLRFLGRANQCVLALLSYQRSRTQSRPTCGFGELGLCPASHQQYFLQEWAGILKKRSARQIILFGGSGEFATAWKKQLRTRNTCWSIARRLQSTESP